MGWWIALAVIVGLAFLPLGIGAKYDTDGAFVWLIVGPFRKKLHPSENRKTTSRKKSTQSGRSSNGKKDGGKLSDFTPLLDEILQFLRSVGSKFYVRKLEACLLIAGDDPCDVAENYGKACAALAALEPQLDRFLRIKKKKLQISCDFIETKSKIWARVDVVITLWRLLTLVSHHGFRALRAYMQIMNKGKGGAQT